jgi:oligopeptide transport system substrate-binding protein
MKKKQVFIILLILSIFLTSCADTENEAEPIVSAGTPAGSVVYVQLSTPVDFIDPAYVQNESEITIAKMIFQGLVRESSTGEVVSCAAERWDVSPDKKTYTFHLKKGIFFHDGKEVTADDFKFSWERVLRLNAPSAYLFDSIQGAAEVLSGKQKQAVGINAVDNYTLKVTLTIPQDNFISSLTHPAAAVLDRYEVVEQAADFAKPGTLSQPGKIPSGIGPFELVEWVDGRIIAIGKNNNYFGAKPALSRVEFSLNQPTEDAVLQVVSGKIDIIQDLVPSETPKLPEQAGAIELFQEPVRQFRYVGINAGLKPFTDKTVRDALCEGIDAAEVLKSVRGTSGEVIPGYITDYWYQKTPSRKAPTNKVPPSNSFLAKGLPELTLFCGPTGEDKLAAEVIVKNLSKKGFKIKVSALPYRDLRKAIRSGEAAFFTAEFVARSPELDVFFSEQVDSQWQKTIKNPAWDQLLAKAVPLGEAERLNIYRQLEEELLSDARICYLYGYNTAAVVAQDMKNFHISQGNNIFFDKITITK